MSFLFSLSKYTVKWSTFTVTQPSCRLTRSWPERMLNRRRRAHRTQPWSEVIIGRLLSVAAIVATQSQSQRRVNILIPAELAMGNAKSIIPAVVVFLRLGVKEVEILPGMGRHPTRSYLLPPPRPWTPSRPPHQCRPWRRRRLHCPKHRSQASDRAAGARSLRPPCRLPSSGSDPWWLESLGCDVMPLVGSRRGGWLGFTAPGFFKCQSGLWGPN